FAVSGCCADRSGPTEKRHDLWTRPAAVVAGHSAADHSSAGIVLASLRRLTRNVDAAGCGIHAPGRVGVRTLPAILGPAPHILKTSNFVSGIGAFSVAARASDSTRRVSDGRIMPSSHSRAVA